MPPIAHGLTRRLFGLGLGTVGAVEFVSTGVYAAATDETWHTDPDKALFNYIRIHGDLSSQVAPFPWRGYYIAITPDRNPQFLFECESCETRKVFPRADGTYEVWSKVMTLFKDPGTGEILSGKTYRNPFTGEDTQVEPNVVGSRGLYYVGDEQRIMYNRYALETTAAAGTNWTAEIEPELTHALELKWYLLGEKVQLIRKTTYPEKRPIPLDQVSTTTVDLSQILDDDLSRIEAVFSVTFLAPWQGFLNMADHPGHAVFHCAGRKVKGFGELSPEYLAEAEKYIPDVLAWAN